MYFSGQLFVHFVFISSGESKYMYILVVQYKVYTYIRNTKHIVRYEMQHSREETLSVDNWVIFVVEQYFDF